MRRAGNGFGASALTSAEAPILQKSLISVTNCFRDSGCRARVDLRPGVRAAVQRADLVGDLHRAEVRAAHGAEVGLLGGGGGQGLVVEGARGGRVEGEVELVLPAELEARVGQGVVPGQGARVALG